MKIEELRQILKPLNAEAVRRLAGKLEIQARTKAELVEAIASRYARRPVAVVDSLLLHDLRQCLKDWHCDTTLGTFYFTNLLGANVAELRATAHRLWVENWRPSRDGDRVVAGGVVTSILVDGIDAVEEQLSFLADGEEESPEEERSDYEDIPTAGDSLVEGTQKNLAQFQQDAVNKLTRRLENGRRRALLCLPTGGGKTRTALHLLLTKYVAEGRKVLWVTHRLDLLDQVHEEVRETLWLISRRRPYVRVSHVYGGATNVSGDVILASSMTLVRNEEVLAALNRDKSLAVVVYDEAHRLVAESTWNAIQRLLQGDRALLGLTATPYRKDPRETELLERVLGKPAYFQSFRELLQVGFLARPVFLRQSMRSTEKFKLSEANAKDTRRAGDFTPEVLAALARHGERDSEIVTHWCSQQNQFGKTIAFACDIEHADRLARTFKVRGVLAESRHSRQPPEHRRRILHNFKEGTTRVLVNVGILTEGTNVPDTKTVLLARPTLSRSLYMQMIGRGARADRTPFRGRPSSM